MKSEKKLKHLGFVRTAAIHVLVTVSYLYDYVKQNSGPLKSAVVKVEAAVTTIITPVYQKFKDVPDTLLFFLDHKFDKHAPSMAKQVVSQAHVLIEKTTEKAQNFVRAARTGGYKAAFSYVATEYMCFLVIISVKVWVKLSQFKIVHDVGHKALAVAANLSGIYNKLVRDMSARGYPVFGYLPLVPVWFVAFGYLSKFF